MPENIPVAVAKVEKKTYTKPRFKMTFWFKDATLFTGIRCGIGPNPPETGKFVIICRDLPLKKISVKLVIAVAKFNTVRVRAAGIDAAIIGTFSKCGSKQSY